VVREGAEPSTSWTIRLKLWGEKGFSRYEVSASSSPAERRFCPEPQGKSDPHGQGAQ